MSRRALSRPGERVRWRGDNVVAPAAAESASLPPKYVDASSSVCAAAGAASLLCLPSTSSGETGAWACNGGWSGKSGDVWLRIRGLRSRGITGQTSKRVENTHISLLVDIPARNDEHVRRGCALTRGGLGCKAGLPCQSVRPLLIRTPVLAARSITDGDLYRHIPGCYVEAATEAFCRFRPRAPERSIGVSAKMRAKMRIFRLSPLRSQKSSRRKTALT